MRKFEEPNAYETAETLIDLLRSLARLVKTITSDNAKQFVMHKWIAEATSSFFFALSSLMGERSKKCLIIVAVDFHGMTKRPKAS